MVANRRQRDFRYWLQGLLPALLMLLAWPLASIARDANELTFVSWGGAYTRSQMLAFVRPYQQRTGADINVLDYNGGLDALRNQVRSLNYKWDVVDLELSDALRGCDEGLLEPISAEDLASGPDNEPAAEDFIPGSLTDCAVGTVIWSTVIAYDRNAFDGDVPHSLQDFFDPERFPGPRGLRRTPKANLEWALIADGVPRERVYAELETEQGLQRAFSVLDRIKPSLVWWEAGIEAPQLLKSGRAVMTSAYNGRIQDAVSGRNEPYAIIWDHQIWNIDLLGIPRDNPRRKQALAFIRFATAPEQLAEQVRHIAYGPVRYSSLTLLSDQARRDLPTRQENFANAMQIDAGWWAMHYDRINQRFEEWLRQPLGVPRKLPR